jgi:hypothetical protein
LPFLVLLALIELSYQQEAAVLGQNDSVVANDALIAGLTPILYVNVGKNMILKQYKMLEDGFKVLLVLAAAMVDLLGDIFP